MFYILILLIILIILIFWFSKNKKNQNDFIFDFLQDTDTTLLRLFKPSDLETSIQITRNSFNYHRYDFPLNNIKELGLLPNSIQKDFLDRIHNEENKDMLSTWLIGYHLSNNQEKIKLYWNHPEGILCREYLPPNNQSIKETILDENSNYYYVKEKKYIKIDEDQNVLEIIKQWIPEDEYKLLYLSDFDLIYQKDENSYHLYPSTKYNLKYYSDFINKYCPILFNSKWFQKNKDYDVYWIGIDKINNDYQITFYVRKYNSMNWFEEILYNLIKML